MGRNCVHVATFVHLGFSELSRRTDHVIFQQVRCALKLAEKSPIPKSVTWDRWRVERRRDCVAVHLFTGAIEKARVEFVPAQEV